MSLGIIVQVLGGLALFLFAMQRMTEGLTLFAGSGLKRLLGRWTSTPLRGVFAGILVTGLVQSSSAVTVA
ncbi:MAG: Na/Pi cotransporter family protein, partial [Reyranella sp.]|nr:Na/Pi cotransporter family protein [Reyranella sp.]